MNGDQLKEALANFIKAYQSMSWWERPRHAVFKYEDAPNMGSHFIGDRTVVILCNDADCKKPECVRRDS